MTKLLNGRVLLIFAFAWVLGACTEDLKTDNGG